VFDTEQLHLVTALEVGHFGRVTSLDERLEPGKDQRRQATAQHRLLAEQVGFTFLPESCFDDPGAAAADSAGIRKPEFGRIARRVLLDRQQARHAGAAEVFGAHGMPWPLWRDHEDVHVGTRLDQPE
jgi:hypothetical protein